MATVKPSANRVLPATNMLASEPSRPSIQSSYLRSWGTVLAAKSCVESSASRSGSRRATRSALQLTRGSSQVVSGRPSAVEPAHSSPHTSPSTTIGAADCDVFISATASVCDAGSPGSADETTYGLRSWTSAAAAGNRRSG